MEFELADDTPAVRFVSHDPLLGDVGETWFRKDGHLFQLSVSAPDRDLQDAWVRDLADRSAWCLHTGSEPQGSRQRPTFTTQRSVDRLVCLRV